MNILNEFRPEKLEEIIGNKSAVSIINKNLKSKVPPQTYMIVGPTGSGKTTLARIIANLLGGEETDIHEVQLRGIDDTRALRDSLGTVPMFGNAKIYILDELHHLTKDGQNDLLKPFEEPPTHVYFILTTTEPNKIIKTIQSRCVKIKTEKLSEEESLELLRKIAEDDQITLSNELEGAIIKKAEGLPRAIITNYAATRGIDNIREALKILTLTSDDNSELIELIRKVVYKSKSWEEVAKLLESLEEDPETVRIVFCNWLRKAMLGSNVQKAGLYARMLNNFLSPYYVEATGKSNLVHDVFLAFTSRFRRS